MTTRDVRQRIREHLAAAGLPPGTEAQVVEELAQHVDDRRRDLVGRGVPEDMALRQALQEIEGHDRLGRDLRRVVGAAATAAHPADVKGRWLAGIWQDVRYAARTLRRSPAFTLAAMLTVALSTGPTMAALGIANGMFWRPISGVRHADRLGIVWFGRWSDRGSFSPWRISYGHLNDMARAFTAIDGIAGTKSETLNVTPPDAPARMIVGESVTANYFDVLGARIAQGRAFRPDEDRDPGGALVTVIAPALARALWPDGGALGRTLHANGYEFTVIGVTADDFTGLDIGRSTEIWFTGMTSARLNHLRRESWAYEPHRGPFSTFVLRLADGATFDQAQAEMTAAAAGLAETGTPGTDIFQSRGPTVFPGVGLEPFARDRTWRTVRLLLVVGALLVALGVANLANLFVFRALGRRQDTAVRRALGASTTRLTRLHVIESLIVTAAGATCGLTLAFLSRSLLQTNLVRGQGALDLAADWRLVGLAIALALAIGVLLGLAPARLAGRTSLGASLAARSRGASAGGTRLRTSLAVAQLALSLMLLAGALLFVQTLANLRRVDLGFSTDGVSTATFSFRTQGYDAARTQQFYRELMPRLQARPGIDAVTAAQGLPQYGGGLGLVVRRPGDDRTADGVEVTLLDATAGFFDVLGIRLLAGRTFTDAESFLPGPEPGVIVNASLARTLFDTEQAVGRTIAMPGLLGRPAHEARVIGVVGDVRWRGFGDGPPDAMVYRPFGFSGAVLSTILAVRTSRPVDVQRLVQIESAALDPALPISADRTLQDIVEQRLAQQRLFAWVLGVLATLGFVLAAVGIHGLASQQVIERTREFGIRLALGDTAGGVMRLVLRSSAVVVGIGIPVGLSIAALGSRLVESQLFGITAIDPATYAAAAAALAAVVVLASLGPALRAARGNPVDVLRTE